MKNEIAIYQAKNGAIELRGDITNETVWATQAQIAEVFNIERSVVTKHINNILNSKELDIKSVCANFAHTADDGKTYQVKYYNLDVILSVGYRTNSAKAIRFRQWATKTLRTYIVNGYLINKNHIAENYENFLKDINEIKSLLPTNSTIEPSDTIELITLFADTWLSLDAYDKDLLPKGKLTKKKVDLTTDKIIKGLLDLKNELIYKSETTDIFGTEINRGTLSGIIGNVMQSFNGQALYQSAEEKAAYLLYFIIKDHPFVDGNKRSGAFVFIWVLKQTGILDIQKLTPSVLTTLTLLVAESNPSDKDKVIKLVINLISKK